MQHLIEVLVQLTQSHLVVGGS